jgi:hypothetical protein
MREPEPGEPKSLPAAAQMARFAIARAAATSMTPAMHVDSGQRELNIGARNVARKSDVNARLSLVGRRI